MSSPSAPATTDTPAIRRWEDLPGPRPLPLVGNALQLDLSVLHQGFERWVQVHGPLFRASLGRTRILVLSDHRVIAELLRQRPNDFRRPAMLDLILREMGLPTGLFNAEGAKWERQRRMVMAAFAPGHVRAYFPALRRVAVRMRARWQGAARGQDRIELQTDLMRFTVDAIAGLAFGQEIDTIGSGEDIIQQHLDRIFPALYKRVNALVPWWRLLPSKADRELAHSVREVNAAIAGFMAQARARLVADPARREHPDNLLEAMLVAADEPGSGLSDDDVAGNVVTMLLAGEDTTANTLCWMIHLLHRHPEALARATLEVRQHVPDIASVTPEALARLDYVEACAHETMRLRPVAPFNVLELVHDLPVAGVGLRRGDLVFCAMRPDATSSASFEHPHSFLPERWLDTLDAPGGGAMNAKRVSMPFGGGPRVCPGRYLAILEMKLLMAMLLSHFDIVDVDTPDGAMAREQMNFTMTPVGLGLRLRERPGA